MTRLARFLALSPAERAILLKALCWLPVTAARVRLRGLGRQPAVSVPRARAAVAPARVAELVDIASRHGLVRGNCLSRSLTLQRLLHGSGVPAQLRIGARHVGDGVAAHAWVELGGRPLNDAPDVAERYPPFPALPAALPRLV
jgi:hypothetical protein